MKSICRWASSMWTVSPSTVVAKHPRAPTLHRRTALCPLHPMLAMRALLELSPMSEQYKISFLLLLIHIHNLLILFTADILMEGTFAAQAIWFIAREAFELSDIFIVLEYNWAIWGWATACCLSVPFDVFGEEKVGVSLVQLWRKDRAHYPPLHAYVAVLLRARNHIFSVLDLGSNMLTETIAMEGMFAIQFKAVIWLELEVADRALSVSFIDRPIFIQMGVVLVCIGLTGLILIELGILPYLHDQWSEFIHKIVSSFSISPIICGPIMMTTNC